MATTLENQIQNMRNRFMSSQAGRFFNWWFAELRGFLPASWQARMQHARRRLVMHLSGTDLVLSVHEFGGVHELDRFGVDQDIGLQRQQIQDLLAERELLEVARDLLVAEDEVLRKEVPMPLAAESNLRQALAFDLDRQTPFAAEDVYFDCRVLERDRDAGQIRVELLVTPRQPVDAAIGFLRHRGMAPTGVDVEVDGKPAGLNLLPFEQRFRMVNPRSRTNMLLGVAAVVLMAVVMVQSLWLRQHQVNEVQEAIEMVREEAQRVQEIREQIDDASEAAGFMLDKRAAELPTVAVLAEVTRILPDDTYLDRLMIGQGTVQMQGKSDNAQQLIELVNQSDLFTDASFRGPTRLDTRTQKEIFDLNATLVQGED